MKIISNKTNEEILNILKQNTYFDNCRDMCNTLGFEYDSNHPSTNLNKLSLYCTWHKNNKNIFIDNVFSEALLDKHAFKFEIGQTIESNTGKFIILNRYRKIYKSYKDKHRYKTYLCKCLIDDYEFELKETHISQGIGCPKCGGRKPILGHNTIYDLRKDLLKYIVNIEDAKTNSISSEKQILCKCPICDNEKYVRINNLSRSGFSCSYCSDNISYPNKFIRGLLNQLKINYVPEKRFNWSDGRVYDFFLVDYNCIIEAHGLQHYKDVTFTTRNLQEEQENDNYKKKMALDNSIQYYVVLDCRNSNLSFIKNSILSSDLFQILSVDCSKINWLDCDKYATRTMIFDICLEWTKNHNITELSNQFDLDPHTIISYLEKGSSFGLCNYSKGNREHMRDITRDVKSKPILCRELDILFYSRRECEKYFISHGDNKFRGQDLYQYINANKAYHGYMFEYIDKLTYNNIKTESLNNNSQYTVYGEYYKKGV